VAQPKLLLSRLKAKLSYGSDHQWRMV